MSWFASHGFTAVAEYKFHPARKWRFDYAFPDILVAMEVEGGVWTGGRHTRGVGFLKDMEKYSTCAIMGWALIRTTPDDLCSTKTIQMLTEAREYREGQEELIQQRIASAVVLAMQSCHCQSK